MLQILNLSALVAVMLLTGLRVTFAEIITSLRQTRPLILGLLANYILVPAITIALLCAFQANPMVSMGFLILAVCPGAPVVAPLTDLARGNVPLAVGLMIVMAASSATLSPALLMFLSSQLSMPPNLHIDYLGIIKALLIAQIVPLSIGLTLRHFFPRFSQVLIKPLGILSLLLLLAVILFVLITQNQMLTAVRLRGWIGMMILLFATLAIGWFCGGKDRKVQKTLALVTVSRNAGVGLVIALSNFAGTPTVSSVVIYTLFSIAMSLLVSLFFRRISSESDGNSLDKEPLT